MLDKKAKPYNPTIDLLRVIAILAVVLIHTTTHTLEIIHFDIVHSPWTVFLNQSARFAVTLFFFISGFVLELNYNRHTSYLSFIKRRLSRLLIPYLFWSLIYFIFIYNSTKTSVWSMKFIHTLLVGSASYQLYFIPTLLLFYFLFPILHKYYRIISNKYVMITTGTIQILLLGFDFYIRSFHLSVPLRIALLNFFIFPLGMIASHHHEVIIKKFRSFKPLSIALTIFFAVLVTAEAIFMFIKRHNSNYLYNQWRPTVLIYTLLLTGTLYTQFQNSTRFNHIIKKMAGLSLFVYFIHVIIIELVWGNAVSYIHEATNDWFVRQFWYDPLYFLLIVFISFAAAAGVHSVWKLKWITG